MARQMKIVGAVGAMNERTQRLSANRVNAQRRWCLPARLYQVASVNNGGTRTCRGVLSKYILVVPTNKRRIGSNLRLVRTIDIFLCVTMKKISESQVSPFFRIPTSAVRMALSLYVVWLSSFEKVLLVFCSLELLQ